MDIANPFSSAIEDLGLVAFGNCAEIADMGATFWLAAVPYTTRGDTLYNVARIHILEAAFCALALANHVACAIQEEATWMHAIDIAVRREVLENLIFSAEVHMR